jgi:hypothetical protein
MLKPERKWAACGETFTTYAEALARIKQSKQDSHASALAHFIEHIFDSCDIFLSTTQLSSVIAKDLLLRFTIKPKPKK